MQLASTLGSHEVSCVHPLLQPRPRLIDSRKVTDDGQCARGYFGPVRGHNKRSCVRVNECGGLVACASDGVGGPLVSNVPQAFRHERKKQLENPFRSHTQKTPPPSPKGPTELKISLSGILGMLDAFESPIILHIKISLKTSVMR